VGQVSERLAPLAVFAVQFAVVRSQHRAQSAQAPSCPMQTKKYRSRQRLTSFLGIVGVDDHFEDQINQLFRLRFHASAGVGDLVRAHKDKPLGVSAALRHINRYPKASKRAQCVLLCRYAAVPKQARFAVCLKTVKTENFPVTGAAYRE
jgi:hypothetical protein